MTQNDEILERIAAIKASADSIPTQAAVARAAVSSGTSGGYTESLIEEAIEVTETVITNFRAAGFVNEPDFALKNPFPQYGAPFYGMVRDLPVTTDPLSGSPWRELTKPGIYEIDYDDDGIHVKVRNTTPDEGPLAYWLIVKKRPLSSDQTITIHTKNTWETDHWIDTLTLTPAKFTINDEYYPFVAGGERILSIYSEIYDGALETFASIDTYEGPIGEHLGLVDQLVAVETGDLPTFGSRTRHLKIGDGSDNDIILSCGTISGGSNSGSFVNSSPSFFYNQNNMFTLVSNVPTTANKESGVIISTDYQNEMVIGNQSTEVETASLQIQFSPNRAISFQNEDRAYLVVAEDSKALTSEGPNLQLLTYDNGGTLLSVNTHVAHNVIELMYFVRGNEKYILRVENVGPYENQGFVRLMTFDQNLKDLRVLTSSPLNTNPIGASIIRAKGEVYLAIWGNEPTDTRLYRMDSTSIFNEVTTLPEYFRGLKEFEVIGYDDDGLPIMSAIRKNDSHIVLVKFDVISPTQTTLSSSIRQDYVPGTQGVPSGFVPKELLKMDGNDGSVLILATQRARGERNNYGKVSVALSSSNAVTLGESSTLSDYTAIEAFQVEGLSYVSGVVPSPTPESDGHVKVSIHHAGNIFNEVLSIAVKDPVSATFETINTRHYLFVSQGDGTVRTFELVLGQFGFGWATFALPDVTTLPV